MANRTLAQHDEQPNPNGWRSTLTIERLSSGAPGLIFIIENFMGDEHIDSSSVLIEDGAAFLAPVNAWLRGNDPEPWTDGETRRAKKFGPYLPIGQLTSYFDPRPGYNQNREDYS